MVGSFLGMIEHSCLLESYREEEELRDLMKKFKISAEKDRRSRPQSDNSVSKRPRDENFAKKLILGVGLEITNVC